MQKAVLYSLVRAHGGRAGPLFALLVVALLVAIPFTATRTNQLDENAIKQNRPPLSRSSVAFVRWNDGVAQWRRRLVHGRRSSGAEVVAVYVNVESPASVQLASALADVLQRSIDVSCDVQFFFVAPHTRWPLPQAYTRAALVLNVSTLQQPRLCFDVFAHNAMQPNQDLVNAALTCTTNDIDVDMLCDTATHHRRRGRRGRAAALSAAAAQRHVAAAVLRDGVECAHYLYDALVTAVQTERRPQPWHDLARRGAVSTLAFASPSAHDADVTASTTDTVPPQRADEVAQRLLLCVLQTVYALSGLEERFHHSTFAWLPASSWRYVDGDMLRLVVVMLLLSMAGVTYANYQLDGAAASFVVVWLWCTPVLASLAVAATTAVTVCTPLRSVAVGLVSLCAAVTLRRYMTHAALVPWCFANIVALSVLFVVHLPMAVLGGTAAMVQLLCLYPASRHMTRAWLLVGTVASWLVYAYFAVHLRFPAMGTSGVATLYTSFFLYPNAVCVTSRCMYTLRAHPPRPPSNNVGNDDSKRDT